MSDDNILQFPTGASQSQSQSTTPAASSAASPMASLAQSLGMPALSADQEKALQIILSGMSYVCIGIQDTGGGADFFTAIEGEATELREALPHLEGVIERGYDRRNY